MAIESGLSPFQRLAKGFRKQADKIVAFCGHQITPGKIEGFNNLVLGVVYTEPVASQILTTPGSSSESFLSSKPDGEFFYLS